MREMSYKRYKKLLDDVLESMDKRQEDPIADMIGDEIERLLDEEIKSHQKVAPHIKTN